MCSSPFSAHVHLLLPTSSGILLMQECRLRLATPRRRCAPSGVTLCLRLITHCFVALLLSFVALGALSCFFFFCLLSPLPLFFTVLHSHPPPSFVLLDCFSLCSISLIFCFISQIAKQWLFWNYSWALLLFLEWPDTNAVSKACKHDCLSPTTSPPSSFLFGCCCL